MQPDFPTTVHQAQRGDRNAFHSLFSAHLPPLAAFIRMRAGGAILHRESIADLVQSVCREVLEDMDDFEYRGEAAFRNYLFLKASHKIMDRGRFHRAARRDIGAEVNVADSTGASNLLECYATFCTPSRIVLAKEELQRIEDGIAALPDNQRVAVALSRILELSYNEVAERMETTEAAARSLVARGLTTLARKLAISEDPG